MQQAARGTSAAALSSPPAFLDWCRLWCRLWLWLGQGGRLGCCCWLLLLLHLKVLAAATHLVAQAAERVLHLTTSSKQHKHKHHQF